MTCWYVYGEKCERHGRCQGCEVYNRWHEERMRMFGMRDDKMKKGDDRMGYKNVHESIVKIEDLNDLNLKKYTRRCLKDLEFAVKEGPMIEDILLKNGKTSYRVEITLSVFAHKED